MRQCFVVCYDIAEPQRWRRVYRHMLGVGDPVQYSVFRCDLSSAEKTLLLEKLVAVMNQAEDRIMFIQIGPAGHDRSDDRRIETWGKPLIDMPKRGPLIV